jgi:hypothetical protein
VQVKEVSPQYFLNKISVCSEGLVNDITLQLLTIEIALSLFESPLN